MVGHTVTPTTVGMINDRRVLTNCGCEHIAAAFVVFKPMNCSRRSLSRTNMGTSSRGSDAKVCVADQLFVKSKRDVLKTERQVRNVSSLERPALPHVVERLGESISSV